MTFQVEHGSNYDQYRLVLVVDQASRILAKQEGSSFNLPHVVIPTRTRLAEQVTRVVRERWNVDSIVIDVLPRQQHLHFCVVAEVQDLGNLHPPDGYNLVALEDIESSELTPDELATLTEIRKGTVGLRGPFSRTGWLIEARQWIQESVTSRNVVFTGRTYQLNAGGRFAAIRLDTQQPPAYWLKATGAPNEQEFGITTALAMIFPQYLPTLVAARQDWNAWVMEDAGETLWKSASLPVFEKAIRSLAGLQMGSIDKKDALVAAGCAFSTISLLQSKLSTLVDYLDCAMSRQQSTRVAPLSHKRLYELGTILHHACAAMQELQIPDCLVHNDASPGNILFNGDKCVFTDWAEGCIGNPFLTFQYLLVQLGSAGRPINIPVDPLRILYRNQWRDRLPKKDIERAFELAPILTIAHHLYGRGDLFDAPAGTSAAFDSHARSLARHIDREAQKPGLLELLC